MNNLHPYTSVYGLQNSSYCYSPNIYENSTHSNYHNTHGNEIQLPDLSSSCSLQNHNQHYHRSPVDVLLKVFPKKRRGEIETLLHRFRGKIKKIIYYCKKSYISFYIYIVDSIMSCLSAAHRPSQPHLDPFATPLPSQNNVKIYEFLRVFNVKIVP